MKSVKQNFVSKTVAILFICSALIFSSCAKDADAAANSAGQSAGNINGTWKTTGGFIVKISGVSASAMGKGIVSAVGNSFPSTASGGECMSEVEYIRGGYWEAYFNTYFTSSGWKRGGVVGLAMNDAGTEFKIGSAVYVRQ